MRKETILLFATFISAASLSAQDIPLEKKMFMLDSISQNPSGMIYFFDGKEISERNLYEKAFNGELNNASGTGFFSSKDAILHCGERYRYGVVFWNTNKKEENENQDNE